MSAIDAKGGRKHELCWIGHDMGSRRHGAGTGSAMNEGICSPGINTSTPLP